MDSSGEIEHSEIEMQITAYEDKINKVIGKIREELQKRREIRAEIDKAKKREASQILILERFDEYDSVVRKQCESVQNMQDNDSMKQIVLLDQYEKMLKEQEDVWAKYKVEYDDLPLAKELRSIKTDVLKINIQVELTNYRLNEAKRNANLLSNIHKRQEQIKIINFATLWIEHRAREKHCSELSSKIKNLQIRKRETESEVKNLEKEVSVKEVAHEVTKPSVPRFPQIDLSQIVIRKSNNRDDNYDTQSINSYILEREYMNIDVQSNQLPHKNSTNKNTPEESSQTHTSETLMEGLDEPESEEMLLYQSMASHPAQGFDRTGDSSKRVKPGSQESQASNTENELYNETEVNRHNFKKQRVQSNQIHNYMHIVENSIKEYDHFRGNKKSSQENEINYSPPKSMFILKEQRTGHPDQTAKVQQSERNNEQNKRINGNFQAKKKLSQEFQMNSFTNSYKNQDSLQMNDSNMSKKRGHQQQQSNENMMANHRLITCNAVERSVPSPSKMAKRSSQDMLFQQQNQQQQQQQQQQRQQQQQQQRQQQQQMMQRSPRINPDANNLSKDLSRLPQSSNKPVIKSCERVNFVNMPMHFQQMELPQKVDPNAYAEASASRGLMMTMGNGQDDSSMEFEPASVNVTPIKPLKNNVPPSSMMSRGTMDPTMWGDTVSDILGSEITEPGGSFELAKRIYADSDLASEDEVFDYEKMMMGKVCSPMVTNDPQPARCQVNANNQVAANLNNEVQNTKAEIPNERNFTFGTFAKKQQTSQRLF